MKKLSPKRALKILRGMDSGEMDCMPIEPHEVCYAKYHSYPNIEVKIFDDGGEWDYVDQVKEGDLVWNPYRPLNSKHRDIFFWEPTNWERWENPSWNDTDHSGPKDLPSNAAL